MPEEQIKKTECQAFDCENAAEDGMRLFCSHHWSLIPVRIKQLLDDMYDEDPKSEKHLAWSHEVRKTVAMLMGLERGLKRNKGKKNLDDFPKASPFSTGPVKPSIDVGSNGGNGDA